MSDQSPESVDIRPERTTNPDYAERGAWFVDDGVGVEFFDSEEAAQEYADRCMADDQHEALVAEIRAEGGGLLDLLDEAKSAMLDAVPGGTFVDPRPLQEIVLRAWLEANHYVRTPPGEASS